MHAQKARFFRLRLFLGSLLVVLLAVALDLYTSLIIPDVAPPDDSSLFIAPRFYPLGQNGITYFLGSFPYAARDPDFLANTTAHGVTSSDAQKILDGQLRNDAVVDAFLRHAQPSVDHLASVLDRPYFSSTGPINFWNRSFLFFNKARPVARTLRLAAFRHLQAGGDAAATQDVLLLRLFATRICERPEQLPVVLGASVIANLADDPAIALLNSLALSLDDQAALAQAFSGDKYWTNALRQSLAYQYQMLAHELRDKYSDPIGSLTDGTSSNDPPAVVKAAMDDWLRITFHPNYVRQQLFPYFQQMRVALQGPFSKIKVRNPFADSSLYPPVRNSSLASPNLGSWFYIECVIPSYQLSFAHAYLRDAQDRLFQTGFALRRYFTDHGVLPSTLHFLVPAYLPAIPIDPFNGQPLHYNPAKGLLYSVGISLKDTGGSSFHGPYRYHPNDPTPFNDLSQPTLLLTFQTSNAPLSEDGTRNSQL
jgi:hypothetical protein